jgi:hypothetical protein
MLDQSKNSRTVKAARPIPALELVELTEVIKKVISGYSPRKMPSTMKNNLAHWRPNENHHTQHLVSYPRYRRILLCEMIAFGKLPANIPIDF